MTLPPTASAILVTRTPDLIFRATYRGNVDTNGWVTYDHPLSPDKSFLLNACAAVAEIATINRVWGTWLLIDVPMPEDQYLFIKNADFTVTSAVHIVRVTKRTIPNFISTYSKVD